MISLAGLFIGMPVQARENVIHRGIYVNDIDLTDKSKEEAKEEIEAYVASFGDSQITLHVEDEGTITACAADLGLKWGNEEILEEATSFGRDGDILRCYKELKDLELKNKVYTVSFVFDQDKMAY